jgi:hypothetical protein
MQHVSASEVGTFDRFVLFNSGDARDPFPFYATGKDRKHVLMDREDELVRARTVDELKNKLLGL